MFFIDHGTPDGWTNLHGYGCHIFKWVNKEGKFVYIKYHFLAEHGRHDLTQPEAIRISGENPDYSKQQLWEGIEAGKEFKWKAYIQVMKPEDADAEKLGFDPFDVTEVWPKGQFPLQEFGNLVLNKNPENFHRDVEQAAFSPGSMIPGVEDSPDPLLQFRMFFYRDAQYHRIGVNLHQIPVNCPFAASSLSSINFDGQIRVDANHAGNKQYTPNSFTDKFRPDVAEAPYKVSDNVVSRKSHYYHKGKLSEYDQPRELYRRVMSEQDRANLHSNTAKMLSHVNYPIIAKRYLSQIYNVAPEYATAVYDLTNFKFKEKEGVFEFTEVEELAKEAHTLSKTKKFRPEDGNRLTGYAPEKPFYQL
ncbi:Vegetative catalase [Fulvia fulva]|uniref:Vegetative catalase n=1 Tax=Passalora fulva TaxID=5499 RepID=A0A9Q8P8Y6_PASFU|nr:Vegetative catalase [Fulvia fulva]UJO17401.1 Vegetative catalase [Fulvia fulva]WPV15336.1 Vegetative catalase [Fulvia fulva]